MQIQIWYILKCIYRPGWCYISIQTAILLKTKTKIYLTSLMLCVRQKGHILLHDSQKKKLIHTVVSRVATLTNADNQRKRYHKL